MIDPPATLAEIKGEIRRADYLAAFDKARQRLESGDRDPELRYLSVLALARAGATARAATEYRREMLHLVQRGVVPDAVWVDCLALWPRILKDVALSAPPADRARLLRRAARGYHAVFRLTGQYFPGINAATLSLLSGDAAQARALASELLERSDLAEADAYWAIATRAEALVIMGRWDEAAAALVRARQIAGTDFGALSSTRRQLAMLLDALAAETTLPRDLVALVSLPVVCHFDGSEMGGADETTFRAAVAAALGTASVGFGVGPLWTTGALVAAEEILARGAELHVVLPFSEPDFLNEIAARTSEAETARRARCLAEASTVISATSDGDFPDPELIGYAELIAAGLAETRARSLTTVCLQLAHLVAMPAASPPRHDAAAGRLSSPPVRQAHETEADCTREVRTILFADVFRFSTIPESRLPGFWSGFMGAIAETLETFSGSILYRNTWGDALFLIVSDIEVAAELALAVQDRAAALRHHNRAAPELRIGLHHGPVFRGWDPVRGVPSYFGTQVSRTARVEPIAPPGAVYVTEPFAAILATTGSQGFEAEYVGRVPLAKRYGEHRMYRLARRWTSAPAAG